ESAMLVRLVATPSDDRSACADRCAFGGARWAGGWAGPAPNRGAQGVRGRRCRRTARPAAGVVTPASPAHVRGRRPADLRKGPTMSRCRHQTAALVAAAVTLLACSNKQRLGE